jgi:hypothetical protein
LRMGTQSIFIGMVFPRRGHSFEKMRKSLTNCN